jgi:hypothetical protein
MTYTRSYFLSLIIILGLIIITPIVLSTLTVNIMIKSSGKILPLKTSITYISEIRGVYFDEGFYGCSHNWTVIAETLANYGINVVFAQDSTPFNRQPYAEIRAAIDAFHAYGIEYHACMMVLQNCRWDNYSTSTCAIMSDGSVHSVYSHCPIKAHDYVLSAIKDYIETFPDVDGIMLDFIRYSEATDDICYCPYCRAAFDEWYYQNYGEHVSNWTDFYSIGSKHDIYLEWRIIPINNLVKDIYNLIKSMNPNITLSASVWTVGRNNPILFRKYLGQDVAAWIKDGYIDFIAVMIYTNDINELDDCTDGNIKYRMGGQPEGPIPVTIALDCARKNTPASLASQIQMVREKGFDGWVLWYYNGPGVNRSGIDIRDYLQVLEMPPTFLIYDIQVQINGRNATISWKTTLPATSKVEYGTSPLFGATWEYWYFHYWNITRNIQYTASNNANVTEHTITLNNLANGTFYVRVLSKGTSGIATSKLLTFTLQS